MASAIAAVPFAEKAPEAAPERQFGARIGLLIIGASV
jgi:hypothetical protein